MKKFILSLFVLAINFLIANASLAENFYIKNYDVEMQVAKNKSITITETIDVYFTNSAHGIYRKIPTKQLVVRADDSTYTNYPDIKNISVNEQYTTKYQNNNLIIKIGSLTKMHNKHIIHLKTKERVVNKIYIFKRIYYWWEIDKCNLLNGLSSGTNNTRISALKI